MSTNPETEKLLNQAKLGMMNHKNNVFISTILFSLEINWDKECTTAWVDGINMGINPTWFSELEPKERIGLLAHEAWHVAFNHITRGAGFNPSKWNRAGDYVINNMLKADGYELPKGGLWDSKYDNMSTEQVYSKLPGQPEDDGGDGSGSGNGSMGGDVKQPAPGASQAQTQAIKDKIDDMLVSANTQANMSNQDTGKLPADIARAIDDLINPKLHWSVIFQNFLHAISKDDYSFRKPNRRFFPDFHLPGMIGEGMGHLAYAMDTSGSVSDSQFAEMRSEMVNGRNIANPIRTDVVDFTTEINDVYTLSQDELIEDITFSGYGGTDLHCIFEHYKEDPPDVLIIFSDLYCSVVQQDPGYPVIWIVIDNQNPTVNFGKVIHFTTGDS